MAAFYTRGGLTLTYRMLYIVVLSVCSIYIVRRIDTDAFYLPGKFVRQRFQSQKVILVDRHIQHSWIDGGVGKL